MACMHATAIREHATTIIPLSICVLYYYMCPHSPYALLFMKCWSCVVFFVKKKMSCRQRRWRSLSFSSSLGLQMNASRLHESLAASSTEPYDDIPVESSVAGE